MGSSEAGGLFTIVSSQGERAKSLYSPCQPVFGCGLPWEGSKSLCEEKLQPRLFSRELIAEGCLLAAVQQGNKSFSPETGSGWHITVSTPSFLQGCWRWFTMAWGMGQNSSNEKLQGQRGRHSREGKLVWSRSYHIIEFLH